MNTQFDELSLLRCLPIPLQNAGFEVQTVTKAPPPMILSALLATAATASQSLIDVQYRIDGKPTPVSLYMLTLAESGERKTTVDGLISASLFQHDDARRIQHKQEAKAFNALLRIHKAKVSAISAQIGKATKESEPTELLEAQLEQLEMSAPSEPPTLLACYQDVTIEALLKVMALHSPSACLISSEASGLLKGRIGSAPAALNQAWDGGPVLVNRCDDENPVALTDARLSCNFMLQPGMMQQYLTKKGDEARSSGFLARFLVSFPASTQGTRFINSTSGHSNFARAEFNRIISATLERSNAQNRGGRPERQVLMLDANAWTQWASFANNIEQSLGPGGRLSDIRDSASKIGENVARIAAILHFYSGKQTLIDHESMSNAIFLGNYYLGQFQMLFGAAGYFSKQHQAYVAMEQFLFQYYLRNQGGLVVTRNYLARNAPGKFRDGMSIDSALERLRTEGKVIFVPRGRTLEIHLNWQYFYQNAGRQMLVIR